MSDIDRANLIAELRDYEDTLRAKFSSLGMSEYETDALYRARNGLVDILLSLMDKHADIYECRVPDCEKCAKKRIEQGMNK